MRQLDAVRYVFGICKPIGTIPGTRCGVRIKHYATQSDKRNPENDELSNSLGNYRQNEIGIQMLSKSLHDQLFKSKTMDLANDYKMKVKTHLKSHKLWGRETSTVPDVDFKLPQLEGEDIDSHFRNVAKAQISPYLSKARILSTCCLPSRPKKWLFKSGWTKYCAKTGIGTSVTVPTCDALIFDVEVLMREGQYPTLATAASPDAWYSWCSERLTRKDRSFDQQIYTTDLIPLEGTQEVNTKTQARKDNCCDNDTSRIVIGHNVGFDRTFVKEQYYTEGTSLRFLDTMSMHIAIAGLTSAQRMLYVAKTSQKKGGVTSTTDADPGFLWAKKSTLNNLKDVYNFYCGKTLDKDVRDFFINGKMDDIQTNFQKLMDYCSHDVKATHEVFKKLWPEFCSRFPHPVTIAGMLEMGTAYLPITNNWAKYLTSADDCYEKLQNQLQQQLQTLAIEACLKCSDKSYKNDIWLWNLDWTEKKLPGNRKSKTMKDNALDLKNMYASAIPKKLDHLQKFPKWFTELWPRPAELKSFPVGPSKLSAQRRITPILLRLTWNGFPLYHDVTHGWGYLVPHMDENDIDKELLKQSCDINSPQLTSDDEITQFPIHALHDVCKPMLLKKLKITKSLSDTAKERILLQVERDNDRYTMGQLWTMLRKEDKESKRNISKEEQKSGPFFLASMTGCVFYKLPHKDGNSKRVGNPLAMGFESFIEDKTLESWGSETANTVLKLGKICSYWKNNRDRIKSQMVVKLRDNELSQKYNESGLKDDFGAILPRVVTAGTVTRRAVESTWLTASNAYEDRIGSELKAIIQCPPGYHFVGADVDAQELWIAGVLGDANFAGVHGGTALGWMVLQGSKSDGTDMHSKTAGLLGISREHAKIFNYARIYGAGKQFAQRLLLQFNPQLSSEEARRRVHAMYLATKGKRVKIYNQRTASEEPHLEKEEWHGGSESHMFNKLEEIATSYRPVTPVLGCQISRTLEPRYVANNFITSRINWAVQSSAVDYLHLMLVSMRWLKEKYDISTRFSISIHDEVRYLVASQDRWRAALALQITNLMTRAMFARQLNLNDLPQSVAFFSSVDVDKCIRKEVHMDCVTPSNPDGLHKYYNIPPGEAVDIYQVLEKTKGNLNKPVSQQVDSSHSSEL